MATIPVFNKTDERYAIIAAVFFLVAIFIVLVLITFQIADPKPEPFVQPATTELQELELESLKIEVGGGSAGEPSDQPVSPPKPQVQEILTKKDNPDTKVNTGKGSANTATSSQNTPTNQVESTNPFGSGGSADNGSGGGKFGKDTGVSGTGPQGVGDGSGRTRLNDPKVDDIVSDDNHKIHLRLTINSDGSIVDVRNISSKTTTTDQRIINQVISSVRNQVKYNKKESSALEIVYLTVTLSAT
ncbi:MAG: hypothetical protein ACI9XP_001176 [Lentimonas sp.]|jgi:hypothetical protein